MNPELNQSPLENNQRNPNEQGILAGNILNKLPDVPDEVFAKAELEKAISKDVDDIEKAEYARQKMYEAKAKDYLSDLPESLEDLGGERNAESKRLRDLSLERNREQTDIEAKAMKRINALNVAREAEKAKALADTIELAGKLNEVAPLLKSVEKIFPGNNPDELFQAIETLSPGGVAKPELISAVEKITSIDSSGDFKRFLGESIEAAKQGDSTSPAIGNLYNKIQEIRDEFGLKRIGIGRVTAEARKDGEKEKGIKGLN